LIQVELLRRRLCLVQIQGASLSNSQFLNHVLYNYGWPLVRGDEKAEGMTPPALHSGADSTWAPASALYWDGSVFFCGLRGQALYEANITKTPIALKEHFKGRFGRLRALVLGPDGKFYFSTSNTDGRGFPQKGDDKVIAIDP